MYKRIINWLALKWSNLWRKPVPHILLPGLGRHIDEWQPIADIGHEIKIGWKEHYPWYRRLWDLFFINRRIGIVRNFFPKYYDRFIWGPDPGARALVTDLGMKTCSHGVDEQGPYLDIKLDENGNPEGLKRYIIYDWLYGRPEDTNFADETIGRNEKFLEFLGRKVGQFQMNKELIVKSPDLRDVKHDCPAYIIGNGPSLEKNCQELANVENGIIIALNGALPKIPKVDYFTTGDWLGKKFWFEGVDCSEINAILNVITPPWIADRRFKLGNETCKHFLARNGTKDGDCQACAFYSGKNYGKCSHDSNKTWKNVYFNTINSPEGHVQHVKRVLKEEYDLEVLLLDQAITSTFTAAHWAVQAGCNPIVFVGVDGMLTQDQRMHVEDDIPLSADRRLSYAQEQMTYARALDGAAVFLGRYGIDVYNCTEGGIVGYNPIFYKRQRIKQRPLKEMVEKLNRGKLSWYEKYVKT